MSVFTKFLTIFGMATLVATLWYASAKGYGLSNLYDRQSLNDSSGNRVCPDYQKDQYGNCPPTRHRRSLGARAYFGGGGK
jgi:hypothetical protein